MSKFRNILFVLMGAFGLIAGMGATPAFAAEKDVKTTKVAKVDVNTATEEELEALPGIGAAYASKIIDGRPHASEADLIKAGIPQKTVDKIKDSIKFGKVKAAKAATKPATKPETKPETRAVSKTPTKSSADDVTAKVPPLKGMVWVNTESQIYHKEGDRWYGKTKNGEFMTEDKAIKSGARLSKQDN